MLQLGCRKKPAELSLPPVALTNENDDDLLPTDVLYEVLLRLPAKELCRLRVVCRSWRSLTSDPGFARSHASRHLPLVAGIWKSREVHILDLTCCNNIVRRLHVPHHVYDISIAQLGLLCVSPIYGCHSYVLDPAVAGEVVATLPDAAGDDVDLHQDGSFASVPGLVPNRASFRGSSTTVLGHVLSTGEYEAFRINRYCTGWDNVGVLRLQRITQTCNVTTVSGAATAAGGGGAIRWRARPCPPVGGNSCLRDRVVLDGVAYFLRRRSYYSYLEKKYSKDIEPDAIFAFDLATEKWRPSTLHGPLSSNSSDNELKFSRKRESLQLFVLDGCLVTAHHKNRDCSLDLWFLEYMDDIDKGIWNKRYSIQCVPCCKGRHSSSPPCPLYVLDDGRIVMWDEQQERVLSVYDPKTNMYSRLASMNEYGFMHMHPQTELNRGQTGLRPPFSKQNPQVFFSP